MSDFPIHLSQVRAKVEAKASALPEPTVTMRTAAAVEEADADARTGQNQVKSKVLLHRRLVKITALSFPASKRNSLLT